MSPQDLATLVLVVLAGLFGGYWIVSKLLFGRPPRESPRIAIPQVPEATGAWHEVLKVAPDATVDEIRSAYRRLIAQYHPDKVATLGPEIRELAAAKAQELTVAYGAGLKARGETA